MWSLFVSALVLFLAAPYIDNLLLFSLQIIISLFLAFFATELQEYNLRKEGYQLSDIIVAKSEEEAYFVHYSRSFS